MYAESCMGKVRQEEKTKVVIVDDHPIVRQGLAQLINQEPDLEVCGEAESASEALRVIAARQPDVAVIDLSLKDSSGLELIKDIKVRHEDLQVLVLSMHDESFYAERVLRAGARGYVTKEEGTEKVVEGIRRLLNGEIYLSDRMSGKMICKIVEGKPGAGLSIDRLSDRELEVFELIGQGMGTRQIAKQLHLSVKTVESHRAHVKEKLKLETSTDLLKHAIQWLQVGKRI